MSSVMTDAQALVAKIYDAMGKVDKCDGILSKIKDKGIVFISNNSDPDNIDITYLDGVLTDEDMESAKQFVMGIILQNKEKAEGYLSGIVCGQMKDSKESDVPIKEDIVKVEIEDKKEEEDLPLAEEVEEPQEEVELTIELVRERYTNADGATIEGVAADLGVSKSKLYKFISANGLRKPKQDNTPWRSGHGKR